MPKSVFESTCTSAVSRTTTQPGANARSPARNRRCAPETYRALPSRPRTRTSTPLPAISRSTRSLLIRRVVVVGQQFAAVLGDDDDLFGAVPAVAVVPDDRFEDQHGPDLEHHLTFDLFAEVGAAEGKLGGLSADAVGHVEVGEPWWIASVGVPGGDRHVPGRGPRLDDVEASRDDLRIAAVGGFLGGGGGRGRPPPRPPGRGP